MLYNAKQTRTNKSKVLEKIYKFVCVVLFILDFFLVFFQLESVNFKKVDPNCKRYIKTIDCRTSK